MDEVKGTANNLVVLAETTSSLLPPPKPSQLPLSSDYVAQQDLKVLETCLTASLPVITDERQKRNPGEERGGQRVFIGSGDYAWSGDFRPRVGGDCHVQHQQIIQPGDLATLLPLFRSGRGHFQKQSGASSVLTSSDDRTAKRIGI